MKSRWQTWQNKLTKADKSFAKLLIDGDIVFSFSQLLPPGMSGLDAEMAGPTAAAGSAEAGSLPLSLVFAPPPVYVHGALQYDKPWRPTLQVMQPPSIPLPTTMGGTLLESVSVARPNGQCVKRLSTLWEVLGFFDLSLSVDIRLFQLASSATQLPYPLKPDLVEVLRLTEVCYASKYSWRKQRKQQPNFFTWRVGAFPSCLRGGLKRSAHLTFTIWFCCFNSQIRRYVPCSLWGPRTVHGRAFARAATVLSEICLAGNIQF